MPRIPDVQILADTIIRTHDGKAYYNFTEVKEIIGCGINNVPRVLHDAGILVKKVGPSKLVSAYDIATAMHSDRIAPIDN